MWVKEKVYTDNELFNKVKGQLTVDDITICSQRKKNLLYGYLVDLIKNKYPVMPKQCDRVARLIIKHYGFKMKRL